MREAEFDWSVEGANKGDVVVWEQPATAIYNNPHEHVVIRQRAGPLDEGDPYVTLARENLPAVIRALLECGGMTVEDVLPVVERERPPPKQLAKRLPAPRQEPAEADLLSGVA